MVDRNKQALHNKKVKEQSKPYAKFGKLTDEEKEKLKEIEETQKATEAILNEKRQNYTHALFDYAMSVHLAQQMLEEYKRLECQFENEKNNSKSSIVIDDNEVKLLNGITDTFGLPMSEREFLVILQAKFADLKLTLAKSQQKKIDIIKTWNMTDEQITKQINDWVLGKQKIY